MKTLKEALALYDGQKISAVAVNIKCVEDIPDIRQHLIEKYGSENVEEKDDYFRCAGRSYPKPWLPKERTGTFHVQADHYFIQNEQYSAKGRMTPRRSRYPLAALSVREDGVLISTIDQKNNFYIEYTLLDA